jgi:predicted secreted acid phosphatase
MRRVLLTLLLCCGISEGQQALAPVTGEPANLGAMKARLIQYHSCGEPDCYVPQMERQADIAIGFLKQSVAAAQPKDKLALVLDIDETSLSNWTVELHDDFGYIHNDSDWCIALHCSPAIPSTLRLFHEATKAGVAVFFITGRPEGQRADTAANLMAEGFDHWQELYLRPADHPKSQTTIEFKSSERAKIVAQGYKIVLNVGDQLSDLEGEPQAEHSVKLPNPFYLIP